MDYEHVSGLNRGRTLLKFDFYRTGKFFAKPRSCEKNYRPPESGKQLIPVISVRSIGIVEKMSPRGRAETRQEPLVSRTPELFASL
jgi:hypothetical protein